MEDHEKRDYKKQDRTKIRKFKYTFRTSIPKNIVRRLKLVSGNVLEWSVYDDNTIIIKIIEGDSKN